MSDILAVSQLSGAANTQGPASLARNTGADGRPIDSISLSAQAAEIEVLQDSLSVEGGYDETTAQLFTRIVDVVTGRTVHQIPRAELLELYARFKEFSRELQQAVNRS